MGRLQPILRFSEFEEGYINILFKDAIDNYGYGPRFNANDYNDFGNVKTIRGTDVSLEGEIKYNQVPTAQLDENTIKTHKLKDGDLVMITTADCGLTGVFRQQNIDYIPSAYAVRITLNEKGYPIFFKYFLQTRLAKFQVDKFIRKATVANLPGSDILRFSINIPSFQEQTKIASFLTSVDEKLNLLKEKKAALEEYKKGMMQKIFSQEIRFKDENGKDFPEWEEKSLADCFDYEQPTPYLVNSTDYDDSYETPVLTAGKTFILGYTNEEFGIYKNHPVIIFDDFTTATQFVDFPFKAKSSAMKILKTKGYDNIKFLYEAIQMIHFEIGGHGRHWISVFSVMEIPIPCLEEQIKIASFLSAIDEKIDLVSTQTVETQEYKKGLLQQLFC